MQICPPYHFLLHLHIKVTGNDWLMAVLHIILWHDPVVLYPLFCEKIHRICFRKQRVPDIFFILQDFLYSLRSPFFLPCPGKDAVRLQSSPDLQKAGAFQVFPVDSFDYFCFFRLNDQMPLSVFRISKETVVIDLYKPLLVTVLQADLHILA